MERAWSKLASAMDLQSPVRALVVDEDLFGYDLLLGLNAIRQLGGMTMSDTGEVRYPQHERLMCAAITPR